MTRDQLLVEHTRVCGLITDLSVSDAEVQRALAAFERVDAPADLVAYCLHKLRLTMECRNPGHVTGRQVE